MGCVRASEARKAELKASRKRNDELSFALLELDAIRRQRGDAALELLGNLVAALLCPEWQTISTIEPVRIKGPANETLTLEDHLNGHQPYLTYP